VGSAGRPGRGATCITLHMSGSRDNEHVITMRRPRAGIRWPVTHRESMSTRAGERHAPEHRPAGGLGGKRHMRLGRVHPPAADGQPQHSCWQEPMAGRRRGRREPPSLAGVSQPPAHWARSPARVLSVAREPACTNTDSRFSSERGGLMPGPATSPRSAGSLGSVRRRWLTAGRLGRHAAVAWRRACHAASASPIGVAAGPWTKGQISSEMARQSAVAASSPSTANRPRLMR
jgi:hypothetical protein